MRFSGQKGANPLSVFKWKWRGDTSLITGLLNVVPPEIELSDYGYGRVQSPGHESPTGLLNGESLNAAPIADLDLFFERIYSYYCGKGLWCIITKWMFELLSLGFTLCFSAFVLLFVDWHGLRKAKCGMDAVESGTKPCDLAKEALHEHPLTPLTLSKAVILGYLGLFSIYWIFCFLRFFAELKDTLGIRHFYYNRKFCVRRDFISNPETLRKRVMVVGLAMLILSPFLVIFMVVYLFLRHAEQFYNHPSTASSRRWSNLSKWMFREFNEVDHLFKHRTNNSVVHASDNLTQFPSPIISIIAKFISFISGGFAAILIIIAFLDESLLEGHIFGRNLLWYAAVFGTITAISRAAVTDELLVLDPEATMCMVVRHTHYMPKSWRGKENTETVRIEFETLFQYTGMMLLEEMASIFLTPFLLIFVVPKQVDGILQFIADYTVNVEGVGHVCSFSTFDFQNHGNSNYGSPYHTNHIQRSSQGKMEKLFLSFQTSYPSWEPNAHGKQFLLNLRTFREQKFWGQGTGHAYSRPRMLRGSPGLGFHGDRNNILSREFLDDAHGAGYHQLESFWLIDDEPKNQPYLLDWYYTSRLQNTAGHTHTHSQTSDIPAGPFGVTEQCQGDLWMPPNLAQNEARYEQNWGHKYEDRKELHLEESTSAPSFQESMLQPSFQESMLQHHDSNNLVHPTRSHWWARTGAQNAQPLSSFLEPPVFNQYTGNTNVYANLSERSSDEQEQFLDWRNSLKLSGTSYIDDLEAGGGDVNLHFDDIYHSKPP